MTNKIKIRVLHEIFILVTLTCFFVSLRLFTQAKALKNESNVKEEEALAARRNYQPLDIKLYYAMSPAQTMVYVGYEAEKSDYYEKDKQSDYLYKLAVQRKKIADDLAWRATWGTVAYCCGWTIYLIIILPVQWLCRRRKAPFTFRTKALVFAFFALLLFYTTDGRLITRGAPGLGLQDVFAQTDDSSCHFTWLDKILGRGCVVSIRDIGTPYHVTIKN